MIKLYRLTIRLNLICEINIPLINKIVITVNKIKWNRIGTSTPKFFLSNFN